MGLPLAALLPIGGAVLGGMEGYKKSGGDLGAAALGSGLGALGGGGLRMAGMGLAGQALVGNPIYKTLATKAAKGTLSAGEAALLGGLTKGAGLGGAALGAAGLPLASGLAGSVAGGLKGPAQATAQAAGGVIGYTADGAPVYGNIGGAGVPPVGRYGGMAPYGGPLDVLGPAGMGQRLQTLKDAQTQRDVMRTILPEIMEASEARSKKEFERNMAAAGIRQNIDTRARMQMAAQQAGLQAGLTGLEAASRAAVNQYQYQ
jgi:hypothetical protein